MKTPRSPYRYVAHLLVFSMGLQSMPLFAAGVPSNPLAASTTAAAGTSTPPAAQNYSTSLCLNALPPDSISAGAPKELGYGAAVYNAAKPPVKAGQPAKVAQDSVFKWRKTFLIDGSKAHIQLSNKMPWGMPISKSTNPTKADLSEALQARYDFFAAAFGPGAATIKICQSKANFDQKMYDLLVSKSDFDVAGLDKTACQGAPLSLAQKFYAAKTGYEDFSKSLDQVIKKFEGDASAPGIFQSLAKKNSLGIISSTFSAMQFVPAMQGEFDLAWGRDAFKTGVGSVPVKNYSPNGFYSKFMLQLKNEKKAAEARANAFSKNEEKLKKVADTCKNLGAPLYDEKGVPTKIQPAWTKRDSKGPTLQLDPEKKANETPAPGAEPAAAEAEGGNGKTAEELAAEEENKRIAAENARIQAENDQIDAEAKAEEERQRVLDGANTTGGDVANGDDTQELQTELTETNPADDLDNVDEEFPADENLPPENIGGGKPNDTSNFLEENWPWLVVGGAAVAGGGYYLYKEDKKKKAKRYWGDDSNFGPGGTTTTTTTTTTTSTSTSTATSRLSLLSGVSGVTVGNNVSAIRVALTSASGTVAPLNGVTVTATCVQPSSCTLTGVLSETSTSGIAVFDHLLFQSPHTSVVIEFSAPGMASVRTSAFPVTAQPTRQ